MWSELAGLDLATPGTHALDGRGLGFRGYATELAARAEGGAVGRHFAGEGGTDAGLENRKGKARRGTGVNRNVDVDGMNECAWREIDANGERYVHTKGFKNIWENSIPSESPKEILFKSEVLSDQTKHTETASPSSRLIVMPMMGLATR